MKELSSARSTLSSLFDLCTGEINVKELSSAKITAGILLDLSMGEIAMKEMSSARSTVRLCFRVLVSLINLSSCEGFLLLLTK